MKSGNENILGYEVYTRGVANCINEIIDWIKIGDCCQWLACMNPHCYAVSLKDNSYTQILWDSDWLIPDGIGIVMASKFLGGKIRERVTGFDVFSNLHERLNRNRGGKVFFLGASKETLAIIKGKMKKDYQNIRVVGTFSPPFKPEYTQQELDDMIKAINRAKPDVLWVGMTAPKQEKWIYQNKHRLKVKFVGAIGAVFDFYAGNVKRSHPIFQKLGLEWLPRLIREPRRLWRRMFISAPIFLWHLLLAKLSDSKRNAYL